MLLFVFPILYASCKSKTGDCSTSDDCFTAFSNRFVEALLRQFPEWAASVGRYEYADQVTIPNEETRQQEITFYERYLDSLKQFIPDSLTDENRVDWMLIENELSASLWYRKEFKSYEWNPSGYNVAGTIDLLLTGSFAPLSERLELVSKRLERVPEYYAVARENIADPTPEHTSLAIDQNTSTAGFFQQVLDSAAKAGWDSARINPLRTLTDGASRAAQGYADWLKADVLPTAKRSYAIGQDLFATKFRYDLVASYTPDEIYEHALEEKDEIHTEMLRITQELWPDYFGTRLDSVGLGSVKMLIGKISEHHVHRDSFLPAIERQLQQLEDFVRERDLLYLDPNKPLVVRPTPEYARGVAGAGIDAPGPFEKGRNTYYNVTPLDNYTDEQAESWLREYNFYQLQILNIHEAIPGHYTQLVYSNNSPSLIKSLFGNGTMVEGWACYTEKMMLEEGYGHDVPEMWLIYYKWRLRILCNTLLDIGIHTKGLTKDTALDMLMNEAFQETAEAEAKWKRAQYTSVQLCSYYIGLTEIYDLREECRAIQGEDFSLKQWHEEFLSYGSAPVKLIRELMLAKLKAEA
jgi:uncharacterized protein (DUF885 family)